MSTIFLENHRAATCSLVDVPCDLCGSRDHEPLLTSRDRSWPIQSGHPDADVPPGEWQLVRCPQCELVYLNPRPELSALGQFYPGDYYAYSRPPRVASVTWRSRLKQSIGGAVPATSVPDASSTAAAIMRLRCRRGTFDSAGVGAEGASSSTASSRIFTRL